MLQKSEKSSLATVLWLVDGFDIPIKGYALKCGTDMLLVSNLDLAILAENSHKIWKLK